MNMKLKCTVLALALAAAWGSASATGSRGDDHSSVQSKGSHGSPSFEQSSRSNGHSDLASIFSLAPGLDRKAQGNAYEAMAVSAVPEPETYAMMLAGLVLIGAIARRRRSK